MAVLIEGISVVIKCQAIGEKVPGGVAYFLQHLANKTLRSDGELACVHFMTPHDIRSYVELLGKWGLIYRGRDGVPVDLLVVDQHAGPVISCEWVNFGHFDWDGDPHQPVAVCYARSTKNEEIVVPEGWSYSLSLTVNSQFVKGDSIPLSLEFVRHEEGVDVLKDKETGQNFFIPRP